VPKDKLAEEEPEPEVEFMNIDSVFGKPIKVRGMPVFGLGEASLRQEFPELFPFHEGNSAANSDNEPELGV
jgi:hypothetical protein